MHQCAYGLKQRALVTAYKQPCATGQIDPEQHGMPGWACCSECLAVWLLVSVAGILQAWYDMWFIPAGSQSNNGYACSRLLRALNNTLTLVPLLLLMWFAYCTSVMFDTNPASLSCILNISCICQYAEYAWISLVYSSPEPDRGQKTTITPFVLVSIYPSMLSAYWRPLWETVA